MRTYNAIYFMVHILIYRFRMISVIQNNASRLIGETESHFLRKQDKTCANVSSAHFIL